MPNLLKTVNGFSTTLASPMNISQLTADLSSVSGLGTVTAQQLVISRGTSKEERINFNGVASNTVTIILRGADGTTAQAHDAGETVEIVESAAQQNGIVTNILVGHNDDGTHKTNPAISNPTGQISMYAGSSAPTGWFICDGSAVNRTTYATLFSVIGTTYGVGDGSTTFNLPNLKGSVAAGYDSTQTEFNVLGKTGGEKTHTLTSTEMPSHTHIQDSHLHGTGANTLGVGTPEFSNEIAGFASGGAFGASGRKATSNTGATIATNQNTGGGAAHNNLQPYITLNYIIKS